MTTNPLRIVEARRRTPLAATSAAPAARLVSRRSRTRRVFAAALVVATTAAGVVIAAPPGAVPRAEAAPPGVDLAGKGLVNMSQRDPRWARHKVGKPGQRVTLGACGCFLAAMSTVANYLLHSSQPWYGVESLGADGKGHVAEGFTPPYLAKYLELGRDDGTRPLNWGYKGVRDGFCGVDFSGLAFVGAASPVPLGGKAAFTPTGVRWGFFNGFNDHSRAVTDASLALPRPRPVIAIFEVNPKVYHSVVISGYDPDAFDGKGAYLTLDPLKRTGDISRIPGGGSYDRYQEWLGKIALIVQVVPVWWTDARQSGLDVSDDPAPFDLLVQSPDGRRSGREPSTGQWLAEDPGVSIGALPSFTDPVAGPGPSVDGNTRLTIGHVQAGRYRIEATATGHGRLRLDASSMGANSSEELATVDEEVTAGQRVLLEVDRSEDGTLSARRVSRFTPLARAGPDRPGLTKVPLAFSDAGSEGFGGAAIVTRRWEFGDGATAEGSHVERTYTTEGIYPVRLTVTDEAGESSSDTLIASVVASDRPAPTKRTSIVARSTRGAQPSGPISSSLAASPDGRHVAWATVAPMVPEDGNGLMDVYVRDLYSGVTERVSIATDGSEFTSSTPWRGSDVPVVNADARYVAFRTDAAFDPADTNGEWDVYVRDRRENTTSLVSRGDDGRATGGGRPRITADGRLIAYVGPGGIHLTDGAAGTNVIASRAWDGRPVVGTGHFDLSLDGRVLVFQTTDANVVPGVSSVWTQVYARDLAAATTELVSVAMGGGPGGHYSMFPSVSADGRYVAFESAAQNLHSPDANGWLDDVFVRDRVAMTTELINVSTSGIQGNHHARSVSITQDGRYVAFSSRAGNLVPGDTNGPDMSSGDDVFLRDRAARTTERVSVSDDSQEAPAGTITGSGQVVDDGSVFFSSNADNLASPDWNWRADVFLRHKRDPLPVADPGGPYVGWASSDGSTAIRFDGERSADVFGALLTHTWDFGDGSDPVSGDPIPLHAYESPGTYTVTLTVANGRGTSPPVASTVTVLPPLPPDGTSIDPQCGSAGSQVTVSGHRRLANQWVAQQGWSLHRGPVPLEAVEVRSPWTGSQWIRPRLLDLGVGAREAVPDLTLPGSYEFLVGGKPASFEVPCPSLNRAPSAHAGGPYEALAGEPVTFDGSESSDPENDPLTFVWDFGDGTPSDESVAPQHTYTAVGEYVVHLVTSDGSSSSASEPGDASFALVRVVDKLGTTLSARPLVTAALEGTPVAAVELAARLTESATGAPVVGRVLSFSAADGRHLCEAPTAPDGTASCGGPVEWLLAASTFGYRVAFDGDERFAASSARAEFVHAALVDCVRGSC